MFKRALYYKQEYYHLYSFLCILQLVFLAAFVAYVQAGGPAAYSISALSGDHAYVGSQQEHTVKVCQPRSLFSVLVKYIHMCNLIDFLLQRDSMDKMFIHHTRRRLIPRIRQSVCQALVKVTTF